MKTPALQSAANSLRALATLACVAATGSAWSQATDCLSPNVSVQSIEMRVLVIAADGTENTLPAIRNVLEFVGIPYDVMLAKDTALDTSRLCSLSGGSGWARYNGVVLTTGGLTYFNQATQLWESAFTAEEWTRLWQFEAKYRVRQASLYTYPGSTSPDAYGLGTPSPLWGSGTPVTATLTAAGRQVFPYLNPAATIEFKNTYTYQARATTATPLLQDTAGNAIVSVNNYGDGRQNLAITSDGNPYLTHSLALGYGIVNWVTKGLYVGQRRVYLSPQPDDIVIDDAIWDPATKSDQTGKNYRITADDYKKFITWQTNRNSTRLGSIVSEMPFNGLGTVAGEYPGDTLTPEIRANNSRFHWLSHTYTHTNLDNLSYTQTYAELQNNHQVATNTLRLSSYFKDALVTPQISGLNNAEAVRAMSDFGIRWLVSDSSRFCGHRNAERQALAGCPRPNTGVYHDLQPAILMIPRFPTNLFYNVSTPVEWVDEYNHIYLSFWGRNLTYAEILDKESELMLSYLMNHDMRPLMFHQSNLRAYDGTRSLMGDLIDATITKYSALFNVPPQSRTQRQIGNLMTERMALNTALAPNTGARLQARIVPGLLGTSIVVSNTTTKAAVVPVTGVNWLLAASRESYGSQWTSKVNVGANGGSVTILGAPRW